MIIHCSKLSKTLIEPRRMSLSWVSLAPSLWRQGQSAGKQRSMRRVEVAMRGRRPPTQCNNVIYNWFSQGTTKYNYPFRSLFKSTNGASTSSGATRPDRAADRRIASLTPSLTSAPVSSARSRFCSSTPSNRLA